MNFLETIIGRSVSIERFVDAIFRAHRVENSDELDIRTEAKVGGTDHTDLFQDADSPLIGGDGNGKLTKEEFSNFIKTFYDEDENGKLNDVGPLFGLFGHHESERIFGHYPELWK